MVRTFPRLERQMGLDAHPGLLSTYFRNYRRVVYLAQSGDGALREGAERIASKLGLPLETYIVGTNNLERLLEAVMSGAEPRGKGNPGGPGRPPG